MSSRREEKGFHRSDVRRHDDENAVFLFMNMIVTGTANSKVMPTWADKSDYELLGDIGSEKVIWCYAAEFGRLERVSRWGTHQQSLTIYDALISAVRDRPW